MKYKRNCLIISMMVMALILLLLANDYILADSRSESALEVSSFTDLASNYLHIGGPTVIAAGHPVTLRQQDDAYYAFLPAACKDNAELVSNIPEGIDSSSIVWMYSDHIPAVFIDTLTGSSESINSDKDCREPATITVLEPNGKVSLYQPLEYIKSRGNSSYLQFDKKPYQIKFVDTVPLLGMEEGKTWIFSANASDPSLLRNALARNLANHLGLAQSDPGVFVDLYLNGEYVGNYYVTEKVEVKENRLPLTDLEAATKNANVHKDLSSYETLWTEKTKARDIPYNPKDITGGYLIERDFGNRFLTEVQENDSYFITDAEECFILQFPSNASAKQVAYINDYIQSAENAILSPDGIDPDTESSYDDLIDVDSFVRKYLLEEVTANYDGGVASSFFYKDSDRVDGKLYAGPIWDYDVTFGNTPFYLGNLSDKPDKLTKLAAHENTSPWFCALYEKPDFYENITDCYETEISSYLTKLTEQVLPELTDTIAASAEMDRIRWQDQYLENNEGKESLEESITFLSDYITDRKAFLDRVWIEEEPVYEVTLYIDDVIYDIFSVFEGETLPEFPSPKLSYADFQGWMAEDGSVPDYTAPVYEDTDFHALLK